MGEGFGVDHERYPVGERRTELVARVLAAGLPAYDAASVGSWLHGAAATLASGGGPLVASQVAASIPTAVRGLPDR